MSIAVQGEHGEDAEGGADGHRSGDEEQDAAWRSFHKLPIVSAGAAPQCGALPDRLGVSRRGEWLLLEKGL